MATPEQLRVRFAQAAVVAGATVAAIGLVVLVGGWWLDLGALRQPLADYPAMRAATALGLTLVGLGVLAAGRSGRARGLTTATGAAVLLLGAAIAGAYVAGQPKTWLETAIAIDGTRDAAIDGRVAVNTALCLILAGIALLLLAARRAASLRQGLGVAVFLIAYAAVLGYASETIEVAGGLGPTFTAMAPHTAIPLLLAGFGLVTVDLDRGWARILIAPRAGGRVLRVAMPLLLVTFLAASVLYAVLGGGRSAGGIVLAFLAVAIVIGLVLLFTRLERIDTERHALATDLEERVASQQLDARQATGLLRAQFDAAPNGIAIVGTDGRILDANHTAAVILGRPLADLVGTSLADLALDAGGPDTVRAAAAAAVDRRDTGPVDVRMRDPHGEPAWIRLSFGVMRDEDGTPLLLVATLVDVTARLEAERALRDSEELLRVVLDGSTDIVVRLGPDLRIEYVNQRAVDVSGVPAGEWRGRTLAEMGFPADQVPIWDENHRRVLEGAEPIAYEFGIQFPDGNRWYESTVAPVLGADGSVGHLVITSRDVTARKRAEADLILLATHDPLTRLANRAELREELVRALSAGERSGTSTAAVMIDLDHFKYVNDSLGHAVGDDLLVLVAERLMATVRAGDLVGRLGGDEFLIVMRGLDDPTEAVRAGWRVVEAFREGFVLSGRELRTTATVGVAVSHPGSTADDLVREADTAMYLAKSEGRDRLAVFNEDLAIAVTARVELESQLRRALADGEFEVWFQPEVALATGDVVALEALLRWRRPDGTVMTADRFVPVAEEAGLIVGIGRWVLQRACAEAARWQERRPGSPPTVRVNVSAHQLADPDLLGAIDEALSGSGLAAPLLCLEVTETALLRGTSVVLDNFAGIRSRSVRVALDDFGTGYASLAYLRDHAIDIVKIDRSFVADVPASRHSRQLVSGILAFAASLGIDVTAEGIETEAQAAFLREAGCPTGQGFLFSPALPADLVDKVIATGYPVPVAIAGG